MSAPTLRPTRRSISGVALSAFIVGVVVMMIVPLPTWLLDLLITANLAASVALLLAAVYARDALAIATFPTLLLLATLYRLALNVSTVRLILLQADAGQVVRAFGSFVVRGDYVVGGAVFLVLTIVQYLVIARGAERVAEVAARFTLDAMPGKQLAVDSDLRSGLIDAEEARRRRALLGREAQLFGALDGAMRFVKGDAIAGILILVVSLVGGLAIGLFRRQLELGEAARIYTLLTIGDGLVSQLPALLLSTAAGLVVTRVAAEEEGTTLGEDVLGQLLARPLALAVVALLLVALGAVPGLPALPFLVVAVPFAAGAWIALRRPGEKPPAAPPVLRAPPPTIEVAVDPALAAAAGELAPALDGVVRQVVDDLGLPLPMPTATVDPALPPRGYEVRLRGVPMADGLAPDGKLLAVGSPARLRGLEVEATPAPHPGTGAAAAWVAAAAAPRLEAAGLGGLDSRGVVAAALDGTLRRFAGELLGFDETQRLVDALTRLHPALVREVMGKRIDLATLTEVLRRLLAEGLPIGDLRDVLEALATIRDEERDPAALTERVRVLLRRHLSRRLARGRRVEVLLLDPLIEEALREALRTTDGGPVLALEPALGEDILGAVRRELEARDETAEADAPVALITTPDLRRHLRRLLEGELPTLPVITYQELSPDLRVEPVGRVSVG